MRGFDPLNIQSRVRAARPGTIVEPFRINVVEPIHWTTQPQREQLLRASFYNLFLLPAADVPIDLLTNSATGAMSTHQWAAVIEGERKLCRQPELDRFRDSA
ncbi:MAG: hypothetical protein WB762_09770 [Candidatus Sulfotelmatobacter sp.]